LSPSDQITTDLEIKVLPRSSKSKIVNRVNEVYKVKVTAPPIEGKANKALVELLSKKLGISKGRVEIVSGKASRLKSVRIHGLSMKEIKDMLGF
jgi:uncharacterized protein (TIGR00251 family)